jgi:hypothetical protein
MKNYVNFSPKCEKCNDDLALCEIQINFVKCIYVLRCECLGCDHEMFLGLSIDDFISLDRLRSGGQNEELN